MRSLIFFWESSGHMTRS